MNPKLSVELVPKSSWNVNLRYLLPKEEWDLLRKATYRRYNYRCGVCQARGRMNCHEIWSYNDKFHIQTLVGFIALCDLCHSVKHIGHASILASQGQLEYSELIRHMAAVNKWSIAQCHQYIDYVFQQHQHRSKHEWIVDISKHTKRSPNVSPGGGRR